MKEREPQYFELANYFVVKHNDMIQRSRFALSLEEQRILLYLISKIKPEDDEFKEYKFSIKEFCNIFGISSQAGTSYSDIKNVIKQIADKSIWLPINDKGAVTLARWLSHADIIPQSGIIKIQLDKALMPFLLHLKNNFTQYALLWTLKFRSKYSIRLYEYIKSIHYDEAIPYTAIIELDELKRITGATIPSAKKGIPDEDLYAVYKDFKVRVLEKAISEINDSSDKLVSYEPIKSGRKVTAIKLTISTKSMEERLRLQSAIEARYGNQLSFWINKEGV